MGYRFRLICAALLFIPSCVFASDNLVFALDIIRHGDRTPIFTIPAMNYQWKEGAGQLTAEGMQQEYQLGTEFRKRYIEQTHLLPESYEQGTMYVRSTDYERTLMSAQSLLMGLYPPGTGPNTADFNLPALPNSFQPIPIFSAPSKYDDVILQQVSQQERMRLMQQYVYSTPEWRQKDKEYKDKFPMWSRLTGMQINSLEDLQLLGDTLLIHKLHHAPIPAGLSDADVNEIIDLCHWAFMAEVRPLPLAKAYQTKLMTHVASYLNEGIQPNAKLKYVLLSAHDTTISGALSFLGAPLDVPPPYASNLNFSVYESGANYYTVKVTYNGKPVVIPACGGTVCELQQFVRVVNNPSRGR